jgi:hypothetical protein
MVPCCGGAWTKDLALPNAGDGEYDISNVGQVPEPVDAFLVPTSCSKLLDGDYPGATPQCQVYLGPVVPKSVSGRVKLSAGTYRCLSPINGLFVIKRITHHTVPGLHATSEEHR